MGQSPSGRNCIITINTAPYTRNRKSENSRSSSGSPIKASDPTITPGKLPMPPTMISASTLIDISTLKLCGNTDPSMTAKIAPLMPANAPPIP